MREQGWTKFHRRNLLPTYIDGRIASPGWVARFRWNEELEKREKAAAKRAAKKVATFEKWLAADPMKKFKWTARHHVYVREQLEKITSGETKRLMLFVPPRHGKSELVTVRYAVWRLAKEPGLNIIVGCYNQKLANRFSRKIKKLAESTIEISRKKHAAEEWETAIGGSVKAVGVGAGITGFGGDLIIIDDPVKGRAVANSRNFRDKLWDWYKDDVHTRLEPGAAVVLIQTRWHDDDLAGRLLKDMEDGGEHWNVVRLPALSEPPALAGGQSVTQTTSRSTENTLIPESSSDIDAVAVPAICPPAYAGGSDSSDPLDRNEGEALWPERFSREDLLATKRRLGAWSFAALYQQRPVPEGGTLFKTEQFKNIVSKSPGGLRWARGYDLAVSLKDSADYTASFRCAIDEKKGTLYIADGFRKKIEYPEQRRFVIERMLAEKDTVHGIELALHGKALVQELRRDKSIAGRVLRGIKVDSDKLMRAESWSSYAEEGRVVLVNGPWINDFIDEALRFTGRGDAHDDQIDAVSLAVQMLQKRGTSHGF